MLVHLALVSQALSLVTTSSQDGSQTELVEPIPTSSFKRTEKQELIFRRLHQVLSAKITETMAKEGDSEKDNGGEGSNGSHSPSPCSTVSSSGAVQGEYLVNAEGPQEEEVGNQEQRQEGEDEEEFEDSGKRERERERV